MREILPWVFDEEYFAMTDEEKAWRRYTTDRHHTHWEAHQWDGFPSDAQEDYLRQIDKEKWFLADEILDENQDLHTSIRMRFRLTTFRTDAQDVMARKMQMGWIEQKEIKPYKTEYTATTLGKELYRRLVSREHGRAVWVRDRKRFVAAAQSREDYADLAMF